MKLLAGYRVDWFRLISHLNSAGVSSAEVARMIHVPKRTVIGWRAGSHPKHATGERLIELYCEQLNVERTSVPVIREFDFRL